MGGGWGGFSPSKNSEKCFKSHPGMKFSIIFSNRLRIGKFPFKKMSDYIPDNEQFFNLFTILRIHFVPQYIYMKTV